MKKRNVELLSLLLNEDSIYTYEQLASELNISVRLVRYTIDALNDWLQVNHFEKIKKFHGKGVRLSTNKVERRCIEQKILTNDSNDSFVGKEERKMIILFSILDNGEPVFAQDFQTIFSVSKSAIDSDMRDIRKMCSRFQLEIISTPKNGFRLNGDEWAIRLLLNNIINTRIDVSKFLDSANTALLSLTEQTILNYIDGENFKKIFTTLKEYMEQDRTTDNILYYAQLSVYFSIWKKRYESNHRINGEELFIKKREKKHPRNIVNLFLRKFDMYEIEEIEKTYLGFMVDSLNLKRKTEFSEDWARCQMLCIHLIHQMSQLQNIPYTNEAALFENLFYHLNALLKRLKGKIEIYNPLTHMVRHDFSSTFRDLQQICTNSQEQFGGMISDEEIAYLCIHFGAAREKINAAIKRKYRVIIICGHGVVTGELLAEKLRNQNELDVIGVISSNETGILRKLDADFVLKTTDIPIPQMLSLKVNPILTPDDKVKIQKFIKKNETLFQQNKSCASESNERLFQEIVNLAEKKNKNLDKMAFMQDLQQLFQKYKIEINKRGVQPMISDILADRHILLQQNANNWQEAMRQVAKPLIDDQTIQPEYADAMIDSIHELGPYIVIGPGIALAHARPGLYVNRLGVSIMTLNPPVNFNNEYNDPVSIIFCLAAIDNDSHLKIMSTIVKLINEDGKIEELSSKTNLTDFKKVLFALEE